jgi:imidazolonepropionase
MRLEGASYEEVARAGGGIVSTVARRGAPARTMLLAQALPRLDALMAEGVTTIEVKSGYGLDIETELRMLRARAGWKPRARCACAPAFSAPMRCRPTTRASRRLSRRGLPAALRAAHAEGWPTPSTGSARTSPSRPQIERVFEEARALGLPVKLHAEQLSHLGGTALAARFKALSADHVEYATEDDARAMAASGTVAVLLPGAFYFLRETQAPPVEPSAPTACRWRSPPTAIPAPRR